VAVERRKVLTQRAQVQEAIDAAQQMVCRNVGLKTERVEQLLLRRALIALHRGSPKSRRHGRVFQHNRPKAAVLSLWNGAKLEVMLRRLIARILRLFGHSSPDRSSGGVGVDQRVQKELRYSLATFEDRAQARSAAKRDGVAALVAPAGKQKWLILKCPCGCGQEIALNLMRSHSPRWHVNVTSAQQFNVHPSVDATSCGAHFWLRGGRVSWCE
jgi:hypothetical protein